MKDLTGLLWGPALFLIASMLSVMEKQWYWVVFMLCFAAYHLGVRLWDRGSRDLISRALLVGPWAVLAVMAIDERHWLGVLFYGAILAWHIAERGIKQQRVA